MLIHKGFVKGAISFGLSLAMVITSLSAVASAEERTPTAPDLSSYYTLSIDEISPETKVADFVADIELSDTETVSVYDSEGFLLSGSEYVGNNADVVISENGSVKEVYKVKLYGDLNGDGRIASQDLTELKKTLLGSSEPSDDTVSDISADGATDVIDLIRLKKQQSGSAEISQKRIAAYSERFSSLNNIDVPYSVGAYEQAFEDFSVESKDIDLTFSRYYNSDNTDEGIMGVGWTASFEGSCKTDSENSKTVKIYGQAPLVFKLSGGTYECDYSRATLTVNSAGGFDFKGEDGLTYVFNQSGYLISISDRNSNTVLIDVDFNGKIQKVTDSVGREYTYAYADNGRLSSITDCFSRTVNYSYNESGRLQTVTGVLSAVTYRYDYTGGKLTRVSDAFGKTLTGIAYSTDGSVSSVTDSDGNTTDYAYDSSDNSLTLSENDEVTARYVYNRYNYLTSSSTDEGVQQNIYCNIYGDVVVSENADGVKTRYSYDLFGNAVNVTEVNGDEISTEYNTYDSDGNLLKSENSNGEVSRYTYDANGNVLTAVKELNDEETENISYTYYVDGLVNTLLSDGITTSYTYDSNGYLSGESSSEGNIVTSSYNTVGWLLSEQQNSEGDPDYKYAAYDYNLNGDVIRTADENGVASRTVYDIYGRVKQKLNKAEYNPNYDGLRSTPANDSYSNNGQEVNSGIRYYYAEDGTLSEIRASCYTVLTNGNLKVEEVRAGNTALAVYSYTDDAKELLSSVSYANGQSVSYVYNIDGNITELRYGATTAYTYSYDENGELTSKTDCINNVKTVYTENTVTVSDIGADGELTEKYSYKKENFKRIELPLGYLGEEYELITDSETAPDMERITETFNGQSFSADFTENSMNYGSFTYSAALDDDENVSCASVKKGINSVLKSDYTYNSDNLPATLKNIFDGTENNYTYTYDDDGNIISVTETVGDYYELGGNELPPLDNNTESKEKRYYYDSAGQLIRVDDEELDETVVYEYEGVSGNIKSVKHYPYTTSETVSGTPTSAVTFTYGDSDWSDLLTSLNGNELTYDSLGNLLTYNGYTYSWTAGRHLSSITNGTNTYSYKYDDNGIRTEKTVNGITTYYTTVDGRITGQYDGTNTLYFRYNAENLLIGFNLNGTEYIYLKNIQGDIEGILDLYGVLVVSYTYDAWGKILSVTGSLANTVGTINPMRYRGYYLDSETGYYYLQSRYYNPEFCRFINADEPSMMLLNNYNIIGMNLFAYCNNNSVNFDDITGHFLLVDDLTFLGIAILATVFVAISTSYMSTPQFQQSWYSFSSAVSIGLSWLWNRITVLFQSATTVVTKAVEKNVAKAKAVIQTKRYQDYYWIASKVTFKRKNVTRTTYFPCMPIPQKAAIAYVRIGGDVFASSNAAARRLAIAINGYPPVGP